MNDPYPRVGVGVWIRKDNKILLGKRRGTYAQGTWCPPGGKLDMYENPLDCAKRETKEETGIEIQNVRFMTVTNDITREYGTHYITLAFVADWKSGEPATVEPDKIGDWEWFAWNSLPEPLFIPFANFVALGINPLEFKS